MENYKLCDNCIVMKNWWLYILELEGDKWYVGITSTHPEIRYREHKIGRRAAYWTMKHKPIRIESYEDLGLVSKEHAEAYENKITRQLMKERGLNNVRGGDLRDIGEYIVRFGWVRMKKEWEIFTIAIFFMASTVYLLIDKFFL